MAEAPVRYTAPAVALHWLVAAFIVCAFTLGWVMTDLEVSPLKLKMFNWHKWVGVTVLILALVRIGWRITHKPPPPPPMPALQRWAASVVHVALYIMMLMMPLSGWIYSNAAGYPVVYLGWLPLPTLVQKNKELAAVLKERHELLGVILLSLVAIHVLAALKHQLIDRDGLLQRMSFKSPGSP